MWPSHTINSFKFVAISESVTITSQTYMHAVKHAIQLPLLRIHLAELILIIRLMFKKMLCFCCSPTLNTSLIVIIMAEWGRNRAKGKRLSFWQSTKTQLIFNSTFIEFNYPIHSPPLRHDNGTKSHPIDELKSAIHISHRTEFMDIMKPQFRYYWFDLFSRKYLIGSPTLFEALRLMCYVLVSIRDLMANLCWRTHEMPFLGKWN